MTRKLTDNSYVDATDEIVDSRGRRVDAAYITEAISAGRSVGRPSLSGRGEKSPQIVVRVPAELREQAQLLAAARGVSLSALTREAIEELLHRAG